MSALALIFVLVIFVASSVFLGTFQAEDIQKQQGIFGKIIAPFDRQDTLLVKKEPMHRETPEVVKGIYISAGNFGNESIRKNLIALVERTEINSVVIDLKDFTGRVAYESAVADVADLQTSYIRVTDFAKRVQELHEKGVYVIARLPIFQDSTLAKALPEEAVQFADGSLWRDHAGNAWLDPASSRVREYNLALAREAYELGFDEINFDYIRFISDGPVSAAVYPHWNSSEQTRYEVLESFFKEIHEDLKPLGAITSVDFFGMVLLREDGMIIGQRLQDAMPYIDYIAPMVYPSHYPDGFWGYDNPALYPYEIIYGSMKKGVDLLEKYDMQVASTTGIMAQDRAILARQLRPWIQDFNMGAVYTADMIQKEIQAAYDAESSGWLLWNSRNVYTEGALQNNQ